MRTVATLTILLLTGVTALAQDAPLPVPPRYKVVANVEVYPQRTPKEALASALKAIEREKFDYLTAHLIDPRFVDARVEDRARLIETEVDRDLRQVRTEQRQNPALVQLAERLPDDPKLFAEDVAKEARLRAFRLVARDIRANLLENPDSAKLLRQFLREGAFVDGGETSTATLKDQKDRSVFFRRVGDRWFVEDRQQPEAAPAAPVPTPAPAPAPVKN